MGGLLSADVLCFGAVEVDECSSLKLESLKGIVSVGIDDFCWH